jgi:hypothetical protein
MKAVLWIRRLIAGLSQRNLGFAPGQSISDCGDLSGTGTRFSTEFFHFPLLKPFYHDFPYSYIIWGMNNRRFGGRSSERSSETQSHSIDMNL